VPTGQGEWFAPSNIEDLLAVLEQMEPGKTARFVGGNTGRGKCMDLAKSGTSNFPNLVFQKKNVTFEIF